jgi:hypothetical protein
MHGQLPHRSPGHCCWRSQPRRRPAALADGLSFTNYTTANGLGNNSVRGVYASGSSIYVATEGGLSIAQLPSTPVPGPLPLFGAASAFGFSRKLRRRLRAAASTSC